MNVIIAYLESMFSAHPQTTRLLEAKAELRAMMEDAYTGLIAQGASPNEAAGKVITDFGNLDELAPVLGITAEIGGPDGPEAPPSADKRGAAHPPVTMEEAEGFAEAHRRTRFRLAVGVALSVVAPIPLILLLAAADMDDPALSVPAATAIGVVVLLIATAVAVVVIIGVSGAFSPFTRLQNRRFSPNPVVTRWVDELAQSQESRRITAIKISVLLWVIAPAPIVLATLSQPFHDQSIWIAGSIALTLLIVAVGILVLLPAAWARSVADAVHRADSRTR